MTAPQPSLRSPLGRARGLGSAKQGAHHWWVQRLTAVALVPLSLWFIFSLAGLAGADHAGFTAWLGSPVNATLLALVAAVSFHHAALGIQVVIEDYVADHGLRVASIVAVKLACAGLAALSVVSILLVAFGR
ncbi:MAG: succinate dehydrogenase, hydrophobic membrane anchor protein [Rhodospirillaceae bacterium]|nr:succinate dehydrogenase, hydrophobic membrane anchor protein [Rhodospirillaceae bacterium]